MSQRQADDDAAWRAFVIAERAAQGFGPTCTDEAINDVVAVILGTGLPPAPPSRRRQTRSRTPAPR